ncbi:hypothetical protein SAMN05421820_106243 [Pedobacter steynii]|uniref:Uncharacterized protein n=1 Tax=Pedobacter steynii TaxID=430522 RepID=A0A1G9YWV9_9SPHI|nr:hypothetical protein SAMN05421820_106243 [Pedobacter steynii]
MLQRFCDICSFMNRIFSYLEIDGTDRFSNFTVICVRLNFKGLVFIGLIIKK